jgi:hypothetical protein
MIMSLFDGNLAMTGDEKVERALQGLPLMMATMFPTALLMNWWFAVRVMNAKGRKFWLTPFLTLPVATVLMCATVVIPGLSSETIGRPSYDSITGLAYFLYGSAYYLFVALVMVMGTMLWLTYPLAIVNQWLLRKVFGATVTTPPGFPN